MRAYLCLSFFGVLMGSTLIAQAPADNFKIKKVDVFKNGTAFFTSEGTVRFSGGEGVITPVPASAFGTLWLGTTDKGVTIGGIQSGHEKYFETRPARSNYEALKANLGRKVTFFGADDKQAPLSGIIQSVGGTADNWIVTLRSGDKTVIMNPGWYTSRIEFTEPYVMTGDSTIRDILRLQVSGNPVESRFQMVYFQTQLGWTPAYRIDLLDDKNAQIVLSGLLVNDAQDLDHAGVNLVVGFPHFQTANVLSPLTSPVSIDQFLRALNGENSDYTYQRYNNMMAAQAMSYGPERELAESPSFTQFTAIDGKNEEDLFFYNLPDVSLKKGGRSQVSIFSANVPYQHIYEVALENAFNIQDGYLSGQNTKKEPPQVWHSIKLENKSTNPWTTGAALTLQNGKPLGQDVLRYTPVKSSGTVRITVAPDIKVDDDEKETARKEENKRKDGYSYDLVTITGEIVVTNFKDKSIRLTMTRPVTGKVISAGDNTKVKQLARLSSAVNPENVITWDLTIKAGDEKKLTYQYDVYLRR